MVKFGKQQTPKELLNNLWNSNLMETYVIIVSFQRACNNINTIYGVMRTGKACNTVCVVVCMIHFDKRKAGKKKN